MASDFLIAMRKVRSEISQFRDGPKILFEEYCKLQKYLARNAEKRPKATKEYAVNTFNEIATEEVRFKERLDKAVAGTLVYQKERRPGNTLTRDERNQLTLWSEEADYFGEILNRCADAKAAIVEFLIAYFPKGIASDPNWKRLAEELLPKWNLYRQKIDTLSKTDESALRKKHFQSKVDARYDFLVNQFERTFNASRDKESLLTSEILRYETLFQKEKLPLRGINNIDQPVEGLRFKSNEVNAIRQLYDKLIIRGDHEYNLTELPNSGMVRTGAADYYHVEVEAMAKYLNWLKDFDQHKDLSKEGLFNQIIHGLGTIKIMADDIPTSSMKKETLESYLAKYYKISEEVKKASSIGEGITKLKALVLFYNEKKRAPKVIDISTKREDGSVDYGWIARDSRIDDWISEKIVAPTEDRIARLEELLAIFPNDTLENLQATIRQNEPKFNLLLTPKGRKAIRPIVSNYTDAKPRIIGYMLHAMIELRLLRESVLKGNQIELYAALLETFGEVGTRQALNANLTKLSEPNEYQREQIENHKRQISTLLSKK